MADQAPEWIEVKNSRVEEFEQELHELLRGAASGEFDAELRARGITLPAQLPANAITVQTNRVQGMTPDQFVEISIEYAPLIVPIGRDLWTWAWPKLRDYFDGVARCSNSGD